jgi:GrpB-like predicted nucleotidyltransferase (UPF0157 family)
VPTVDELVTVTEHDPAWASTYEREAARLRAELGEMIVAVEHIGSTAVPGLAGKPIVDVMVGVPAMETSQHVVDRLEAVGYEDCGGIAARRYLRRRRRGEDVNVHVVEHGEILWRANLLFRDYLRAEPDAAGRYAEAKRRAAACAPRLIAYSRLKQGIISELLREAAAWAAPSSAAGSRGGRAGRRRAARAAQAAASGRTSLSRRRRAGG